MARLGLLENWGVEKRSFWWVFLLCFSLSLLQATWGKIEEIFYFILSVQFPQSSCQSKGLSLTVCYSNFIICWGLMTVAKIAVLLIWQHYFMLANDSRYHSSSCAQLLPRQNYWEMFFLQKIICLRCCSYYQESPSTLVSGQLHFYKASVLQIWIQNSDSTNIFVQPPLYLYYWWRW